MKELLKALKAAEEKTNALDKAWEADPDNETLEAEWDKAYKTESNLFAEAAAEIVKISSGKIDVTTARLMLQTKRAEVEKLFA